MTQKTGALEPGLYVTATPIGNLGDITVRALEALKSADLILCEDTRHTARLCAAYGVTTPRAPYHDYNGERVRPEIIRQLRDGARICLVSDAGTPLISDPGFKLVRAARLEGIPVFPLPGASAAIAALSAAGMPSDSFYFAGFLPQKAGARRNRLEAMKTIDATLIFYEAPSRLDACLQEMALIFGDRQATVAREITKAFEEFRSAPLSALADHYRDQPAKGEIVVLVEPPAEHETSNEDIDAHLRSLLTEMSVRDAAAAVAERFGVARKIVYARALNLAKNK